MSARNKPAQKAARRLARVEARARWTTAPGPRITVCRHCDRRRLTTDDRLCVRCVERIVAVICPRRTVTAVRSEPDPITTCGTCGQTSIATPEPRACEVCGK